MNSYNLAVSAAHVYETRRLLEHATAFARPRLILLGVDMYMFRTWSSTGDIVGLNEASLAIGKDGTKQGFPWRDLVGIALSADILWDKLVGIDALNAMSRISSTGLFTLGPDPSSALDTVAETFSRTLEPNTTPFSPRHYGNYGSDYSANLDELRKIFDTARVHSTDLRVVINPLHVTILETLSQSGLLDCHDRWKRDVVALASAYEQATGYPVRIWDFNTVNRVTTETARTERLIDVYREIAFFDPGHFFPKLGDQVQDEVFGPPPLDPLGARIHADSIDRHLTNQRDLLTNWGREHPDVVAWVSRALESAPGNVAEGSASDTCQRP